MSKLWSEVKRWVGLEQPPVRKLRVVQEVQPCRHCWGVGCCFEPAGGKVYRLAVCPRCGGSGIELPGS